MNKKIEKLSSLDNHKVGDDKLDDEFGNDELDIDGLDEFGDKFDDDKVWQLSDNVAHHSPKPQQWTVDDVMVGQRLDKFLASVCCDFSRSFLQKQIDDGNVLVNGQQVKAKYALKAGDVVAFLVVLTPHSHDLPENIALDIVYQDDDLLVVNKPVGLVVHKGAGNWTGTLVNALLYHFPKNAHLPRAGLVHRIDKDTSGLLLVAKNANAQLHLTEQLKEKSVYRHYQCVVVGDVPSLARHKTIDLPIARHATHRTKMAVRQGGKPAVTHLINILALNDDYALVDVALETGRTHQIRVHLSHLGFPLVGDKVYGKTQLPKKGLTDSQWQVVQNFARQALHAYRLGFVHPVSGQKMEVVAPLPDDMNDLINQLRDKQC